MANIKLDKKERDFLRAYGLGGYPQPWANTYRLVVSLRERGLIRVTNTGSIFATDEANKLLTNQGSNRP